MFYTGGENKIKYSIIKIKYSKYSIGIAGTSHA